MSCYLRRATLAGLLSAAAVVALAGCGSDTAAPTSGPASSTTSTPSPTTPSAGDLYAQARKSALAAKSGHVVGSFTEKGKRMDLDLAGAVNGTNQRLKIKAAEGEATILTVNGKSYLTANEKFWSSQAGPGAAKMFRGKYVLLPAAQAKQMGEQSLHQVLTEIFQDGDLSFLQKANSTVEKVTVDGADAWKLTEKIGGEGAAVYVSADGKGALLKISGTKAEPGDVTFTEWDAAPKVAAPPASRVIKPPR